MKKVRRLEAVERIIQSQLNLVLDTQDNEVKLVVEDRELPNKIFQLLKPKVHPTAEAQETIGQRNSATDLEEPARQEIPLTSRSLFDVAKNMMDPALIVTPQESRN